MEVILKKINLDGNDVISISEIEKNLFHTQKLKTFIEEQINISAQRILDKGENSDEVAAGRIDFFIALRSVLSKDLDKREVGLLDAVNDTLQYLGIIESGKTFYK